MIDKLNFFKDDADVSIQRMGKFPVDPKLEEKVAQIRLRMKEEFKRPSLLDGGDYNRKKNTVLNRPVGVTAE